ncbi:hypothetical protein BCR44DRAFT_1515969 [Catenaria anguillulae PL171]|uniref:t-SNARE coiled-coil homology domain-containing protein n=1 Tax=Catenaria anguillulae PL171 TaxID=765915 RepID=A0A1Y2HAW3_9FUNG|nr:hypothetical protein BCR44DRAFT_1515969 [Catenaria anguillulae PL171]
MRTFTLFIAVFALLLLSPAVLAQGNNNNNIVRLIDDLERSRDDLERDINDLRRIRGQGNEINRADLAEVSRRTRDALQNIDNVRDDLINLDNASRQ